MQSASAPNRRRAAGPATLAEFVLVNRLGPRNPDEWMAVLAELTEVVVADVRGAPSPLGIEKAASVVQSRAYLERRAVQLLVPFTKDDGAWRLVTLDFGVEAQHQKCEFLMCFAFQATNNELSIASPYAEVGFALPMQTGEDPIFVLTVRRTAGFIG